MHLLLFVPPPGFAHLPTQFAALFSQCGPSVTAFACESTRTPMPMRVIAKKRCRVLFETPEKNERATKHPNLSTGLNVHYSDRTLIGRAGLAAFGPRGEWVPPRGLIPGRPWRVGHATSGANSRF